MLDFTANVDPFVATVVAIVGLLVDQIPHAPHE
jgi:hypothetical protein